MHPLRLAWRSIAELGPASLSHYALYQLQLRSGWLKARTPTRPWRQGLVNGALPSAGSGLEVEARDFWRPAGGIVSGGAELASACRRLREGVFPLFGREVELGYPPDWMAFAPLAGQQGRPRLEADRHWAEYVLEFFPADVKLLWETSRFGWAISLAQCYRLTQETDCAETFGRLLVSWMEANPLNIGPHWISAQEVALRGLALIYSRFGFAGWLERDKMLSLGLMELIAGGARRVSHSLSYARAQNNNHLLSEAAFLYSVGILFPGLEGSDGWRERGRRALMAGFRSQVDADGGYVQHSVNYHRLALELGLWSVRVAQVCSDARLGAIRDPLRRMLDFLVTVTDPETGRAPNLGPNDGALLFPRTGIAFEDMRPTIQAASAILLGNARYPRGSWDTLAHLLGVDLGEHTGAPPAARAKDALSEAGLHMIQSGEARAFLRCARFRSRPGHADQLHLGIQWRGEPITLDAGTYLYNGDPPWDNSLCSADVHNTATVNGRDQMGRAGRFLYLDWARGTVDGRWESDGLTAIVCRHDGYARQGVIHQRTVVCVDGLFWLIVDDLLGDRPLESEIAWLLPDAPWEIEGDSLRIQRESATVSAEVSGPGAEMRLVRAGELLHGPEGYQPVPQHGWYSPTYAHKQPALHWRAGVAGMPPVRVETRLVIDNGRLADLPELVYRAAQVGRPALEVVRSGARELRL